MEGLEALLALQERDLELDRIGHRRETIPERQALGALAVETDALRRSLETQVAARDAVVAEERRHGDEAERLAGQASAAERRLYSGEVSAPRELQALQADVQQLRRHQRAMEEQALEAMERREPLDAAVASEEAELAARDQEAARLAGAVVATEAKLDAELAVAAAARADVAAGIDPGVVDEYERCRAKAGVGAARLVGMTCQGCHLSVPATEVDRLHRSAPGTLAYCDNCGCILVP